MEQVTQIAALLRGYIEQASPQAGAAFKTAPDIALVGAAAAAALIILFILLSMIGALFKPKKKKSAREDADERPVRAAERTPAPMPTPQPAPSQRAPDAVQKIHRDAESGVARAKQDAERLAEALQRERDKALASGAKFAAEIPTRGFVQLAETLVASDAPALSAARRRIMSGDLDGARADLRRHAQENGGRDGAWRNLAILECLRDLAATVEALEQARAADPNDFVTLIMLRRLYSGTGQPQRAHEAVMAALNAARVEREQAVALDELGVVCLQLDDVAGARDALSKSLALVQKLSAAAPNDFERLRDVAVGHYKMASLKGPDSQQHLEASVEAFERLKKLGRLEAGDEQAFGQLQTILADMRKAGASKQ